MINNGTKMVRENFTLGLEDTLFDGIHDPADHWNGWACPYLSLDGVLKVEKWMNELVKNGEIDSNEGPSVVDGEVFWNDGEGNVSAVSPTFFDGFLFVDEDGEECFEAFYELGNFGWTYEVAPK